MKEVKEQAMGVVLEKAFQAKGSLSAKALSCVYALGV